MANGFSKKGLSVSVFTYYPQNFFESQLLANVQLIQSKKKGRLGLNIIRPLWKEARENDAMISFLDTPNFYASIVKVLIGRKLCSVASYRSMTNFDSIGRSKLWMYRFINYSADTIISNSQHERLRWVGKYPKYIRKWRTIYNAVRPMKYSEQVRRKNRFLVVGSVSQSKNGMVVLMALLSLIGEGLPVEVRWVGQKATEIPDRASYIKRMEQFIKDESLENHFMWVEPKSNIESEYKMADALILASVQEGLPNVVCEAMSLSTPILISDVLDHNLLINEGVEGFLFDPLRKESLAIAIKKFFSLSDSEKREMGKEAKLKADRLFSNSRYIDSFYDLISTKTEC